MAIQSFVDPVVERFFRDGVLPHGAGWARAARVAARKLDMLDYARTLYDLAAPPGNRLEALKGDLAGLYSVRITERWRVTFRWSEFGPADVNICDYH